MLFVSMPFVRKFSLFFKVECCILINDRRLNVLHGVLLLPLEWTELVNDDEDMGDILKLVPIATAGRFVSIGDNGCDNEGSRANKLFRVVSFCDLSTSLSHRPLKRNFDRAENMLLELFVGFTSAARVKL